MDSTLLKGLAVLEKLIHSEQPLGVSALAREFDVPKSNIHRTLSTLLDAGYLNKDSHGNYGVTLKIWELGIPVITNHPICRTASSFMYSLYQEVKETVNLVILDNDESLYLHQIRSPEPIRATNTVGQRAPAIMTVSGRAIIAFMPEPEKLLKDLYAKQQTPKPSRKLSEFIKESQTIREAGYAKSDSIWRPGVNSLAGVVFDKQNHPVAAIAVAGPRERFNKNKMAMLLPSLLNTCTNISRSLNI